MRDISEEAFKLGIISDGEFELLQQRDELRDAVIHVDEFDRNLNKMKKLAKKMNRKAE